VASKEEIVQVLKRRRRKRRKKEELKKVRRKTGNIRGINKLKLQKILSLNFYLIEEKNGYLLCSVSSLDVPLHSLFLRFLSAVLLLYLLMCHLMALNCPGVTWWWLGLWIRVVARVRWNCSRL
jgi:hypothetical protein